jgi:antitoxin component of RelBE/YafQ-DinJ toxin-antitoxin module
MKRVKIFMMRMGEKEKKEAAEKAKDLGLSLAAYIRLLLRQKKNEEIKI